MLRRYVMVGSWLLWGLGSAPASENLDTTIPATRPVPAALGMLPLPATATDSAPAYPEPPARHALDRNQFLTLVKHAIKLKPQSTGPRNGQRPTGLDFQPILASTGQDKAPASFPVDRAKQEDAVTDLADEHKVWALASLLNHEDVDVKIRSARTLLMLADPQTVPALLAAAKANNYGVSGSENATLHALYRSTLKTGLEKITGLKLTPENLRLTEYPQPSEPRVITSNKHPEMFPEDVDFAKVEVWLADKYLPGSPPRPGSVPSTQPTTSAAALTEIHALPGRGVDTARATKDAALVYVARAADDIKITNRGGGHISTVMNLGDGQEIRGGGYVTYARGKQSFDVLEVLRGQAKTGSREITYGFCEESRAFPGSRLERAVRKGETVLLLMSGKGVLLKVLLDTPENRKAVARNAIATQPATRVND